MVKKIVLKGADGTLITVVKVDVSFDKSLAGGEIVRIERYEWIVLDTSDEVPNSFFEYLDKAKVGDVIFDYTVESCE